MKDEKERKQIFEKQENEKQRLQNSAEFSENKKKAYHELDNQKKHYKTDLLSQMRDNLIKKSKQ